MLDPTAYGTSAVKYFHLRVLRTRRLRRLVCFAALLAAVCFADLSASLTCAYWEYFGVYATYFFFFFWKEFVHLVVMERKQSQALRHGADARTRLLLETFCKVMNEWLRTVWPSYE